MNIDELDLYDDEEEVNIEDTYLTFSVSEEDYAVGVQHVTEIVRLQKIIKVPDVPEYIRGVINLRGKVIPVMDIRNRFGLDLVDYSDRTVIIVLELETILTGIVVDRVHDVSEILPKDISPPPHYIGTRGESNVVRGIGRSSEKVHIMLDMDKLIYGDNISVILPEMTGVTS